MKRTVLTLTLALLFGCIGLAWSQVPTQRVIIVDPTGTHAASVTGGSLGTSAAVTVDTISHISSALHVAGIAQTVAVNCVTGCTGSSHLAVSQTAAAWTLAHISSATHVVGTVSCTNCTGGSSDAVNVFHQSTIRHISSTTHVFLVGMSREAHLAAAQSGTWNVFAHIQGGSGHVAVTFAGGGHVAITQGAAALQVDCSNCTAASVVNVGHIASAVHLAGTIKGAQLHVQGLGIPGQAHGGVLTVQGVAGGVNLPISGAVTISSGTVSATQSGAFNVSAAQSGAWTVSAHILSTTGHVAVTMADHFVVRVPGHVAVTQASGRDTLAHISSVTHVVGIGNGGALHVVGLSNVGSGTASSGTTAMACHTTVAFSGTADMILAHSQNSWRIYICSVVLVAAAAESVSIIEGTGSACATVGKGIIGGTGGTMALAANGGFSAISPFPVFSSSTNGNNVCLDKSGSGNVSGSISYRAAP